MTPSWTLADEASTERGASPMTRVVAAVWAPGGAEAHYRRRREQGDWHAAAQRHLFNRMIGQLYHRLQTSQLFDEHVAFPSQLASAA